MISRRMANVETFSFVVLLAESPGLVITNDGGAFEFGLPRFESVSFSTTIAARTATTTSFVIKVASGQGSTRALNVLGSHSK